MPHQTSGTGKKPFAWLTLAWLTPGRIRLEARLLITVMLGSIGTVGCAALLGCGAAQGGPASNMKPVEERRARGVIERALTASGVQPKAGRVIQLAKGAHFNEDIAIVGRPYGVAYLTARETKALGKAIPSYQTQDTQLRLVRGKGGTITLILYEQAYQYDTGSVHRTTAVTAESRLKRDVADYVLHVVLPDNGR